MAPSAHGVGEGRYSDASQNASVSNPVSRLHTGVHRHHVTPTFVTHPDSNGYAGGRDGDRQQHAAADRVPYFESPAGKASSSYVDLQGAFPPSWESQSPGCSSAEIVAQPPGTVYRGLRATDTAMTAFQDFLEVPRDQQSSFGNSRYSHRDLIDALFYNYDQRLNQFAYHFSKLTLN